METEAYINRSMPRIFTKYIHFTDRIFPILKIVVVFQLHVMVPTKCFLLWKQVRSSGQYDRYTENGQYYNQASPRPPLPFLLKQQVRKTRWHT